MDEPDECDAAQSIAAALRIEQPTAVAARHDRRLRRIVVRLNTGSDIAPPPQKARGLENSTALELSIIEITPSGLGLHFPSSMPTCIFQPLLDGYLGSRSWNAARLGRQGGKARSAAKAAAWRADDHLGGRRRKSA